MKELLHGLHILKLDNLLFHIKQKSHMTDIVLSPAKIGSVQKRKKQIKPFAKKDLFYGGNMQKLAKSNQSATWDKFRHLLISTPK